MNFYLLYKLQYIYNTKIFIIKYIYIFYLLYKFVKNDIYYILFIVIIYKTAYLKKFVFEFE